jgi:hypothetical protein
MSTLSYGELFDKSWNAIKENLALSAGLTLVYIVAAACLSIVPILGHFLGGLLTPGYVFCLIKLREQKNIEFADFFWGFMDFNRLLQWVVLNAIKIVLIVIGMIFLVVPGIYLAIGLCLAEPYFVFRKQDGVEAIKASMKLVGQHWWFMFGLIILVGLLNLVGALCFLVGILVTVPMSILIVYYALDAYEKNTPDLHVVNPVS